MCVHPNEHNYLTHSQDVSLCDLCALSVVASVSIFNSL